MDLIRPSPVRGRPRLPIIFSKRNVFVCGWVGLMEFRFENNY